MAKKAKEDKKARDTYGSKVSDADRELSKTEARLLAEYLKSRIDAGVPAIVCGMSCIGIGCDILQEALDYRQAAQVMNRVVISILRMHGRGGATLQ